ncbi:hypothetical protein HF1_07520 [Mycoplasma haemofelis str. Langford 1]|uniref:Uncharacterized protein n=1 Tax=Mycoplasma haemofelis (strain Langford 1) TaxID=941640 RepID=E8ZHY9_MYCHL|nr:hypothetical protein [Mycoplasma haemofelis]CBY92760.1 hypothetical protein HF1_07520 [Mycoplasma haemofelis str. Langford 1]
MKYLIPVSGVALLSSSTALALSSDYPDYTKALEVYFYGKDGNKQERIKIWIEDLGNLSKAKYHDSQSNTWKKISWERGDKFKKYSFLSALASYYIQVQHWINIIRHLEWLKKDSPDSAQVTSHCCKQGTSCTCEAGKCPVGCIGCCPSTSCDHSTIIKNQKQFSLYLTNLASFKGNVYFNPIQVHIKLPDTDSFDGFPSDNSSEKELIGSMTYGFVDYYYKPLNSGFENAFYKSIKPEHGNEANDSKNYYFANYPQSFKFKYDKGKIEEGSSTNLVNIHKELKNKKNLLKGYTNASTSGTCNDISCIIKRNYIQKEEQLSTIQTNLKNSQTCNPSQ